MTVGLSASMASSLAALTQVNDMADVAKSRLNTGKAIQTASDNIAVYFKAQSYSDKADLLSTVNAGISQATANLDIVDKALSNMLDNIKGAQQILNDARQKVVGGGPAVAITNSVGGGATLTSRTGVRWGTTSASVGAGSRNLIGNIVDQTVGPTAAANAASDSFFQNGETFSITFNDPNQPAGKQAQKFFFRAIDPNGAAVPNNIANNGLSAATAMQFNDLSSLTGAMNSAFGKANASFTLNQNAGNYWLGMALGNNSQSITFGMETDTGAGSFDFTKLFGNQAQLNAGTGNRVNLAVANSLNVTTAANAQSFTYSSATPTQTDQTAVDARKQAADFFRQRVVGLNAAVKDAYLPGYANILTGGTLTVDLNETGTTKQSVSIVSAIDFTKAITTTGSAGIFAVGFNSTTNATSFTDPAAATSANFLDDALLASAIAKLATMQTSIGQYRQSLAASKVSLNSRLDFNKTLQTTLDTGANTMTAADTALETAKLAALSNQQTFATTNMANTKQAELNLVQLLR